MSLMIYEIVFLFEKRNNFSYKGTSINRVLVSRRGEEGRESDEKWKGTAM